MESDIGFIGLGNMGFHMAANIRKKMMPFAVLHIFDIDEEVCNVFETKYKNYGSIKISNSAKELTNRSTTVISMVPMDQHARIAYLDPDTGVIAASPNHDRLILECSTIGVSTAQSIGKDIIKSGVGAYVDAPVSGGVRGAEAGTLSFFLGYAGSIEEDSMARRLQNTVEMIGAPERINFCGGLGTGLVCKIVNNYIGLTNLTATAEGMAFGLRYDVDKEILYRCIKGSSGDSWALNFSNPVPGIISESASSNGFKAGFTSRLCAKDIRMGINAAKQVGIHPRMGNVSVKYYEEADKDPQTMGLDGSSIWLHINNSAADLVTSNQ